MREDGRQMSFEGSTGSAGTPAQRNTVLGKRRIGRFWVTLGIASLVIILAAVTPSPFAIEKPGPVVDALSTIDTEAGAVEVVRVSGAETFPTDGALDVLSVSLYGTPESPERWLSVAGALFNRSWAVVPISALYPDTTTAEQRTQQNEELMKSSQENATAAALQALDLPVTGTLTVTAIMEGGPADGLLRDGDVIQTAAGESVTGVGGLRNLVKDHPRSAPLPLGIMRDGEALEVLVTARTPEGGPASADPMLGIGVSTEFEFPFDVDLELDTIGGPSAGLVFALAIFDRLTPGALTGGLHVSGTGTIDDAGNVGAIGGLPQKIWGASGAGSELMLIPLSNCVDVPSRLPSDMTIAPVANLDEALVALESAANGDPVTGLERCGR